MINQKQNLNIIGMMSGTSMDAINVSFVQSDGVFLKRYDINAIVDYNYKTKILLKEAMMNSNNLLKDFSFQNKLIYCITKDHFKAAKKVICKTKIKPDLIGFHGQTIYHNAKRKISIQLGDSQLLSNLLNINVISNFRDNDINNGGEGAPLAPIYHQYLIKELKLPLPSCFLNIGGVSNITFWDGKRLIGFDTGPGNGLMDIYMQKQFGYDYDKSGKLASQGSVNIKILEYFLNLSYFKKKYPKSIDRKEFQHILEMIYNENLKPCDAMATLAECTFLSILLSIKSLPIIPKNLIIMGGGVHNLYILKKLKKIKNINVFTAKEKNIPGDFIEAELIAFLAARSFFNLPITFPNTTGVKKPLYGGVHFLKIK